MAKRHSFSRVLGGLVSVAFLRVTSVLPLPVCRSLGRGIGRLAYLLVPRVSRVGLANLDLAYGDSLSRAEKVRIVREAAANMGIVAAEFSHAPAVARGKYPVRVEGLEHVDPASGALIVGAHLGNWEWQAPYLKRSGWKSAGVVRPLDDPRLNRIVDATRRASGIETISKDESAKALRRYLKEGYMAGILVDQSPRENGAPVRFFGQETWATTGPALIALRARAAVHAAWITRDGSGDYVLHFSPRIDTDLTGDLYADMVAITQGCQDVIEAAIRETPGQWLWMHRRFKPRPRLAEEWAAREARRKG